jgi:hypothetical protein
MMMFQPWALSLQLHIGHSFERWRTPQKGKQAHVRAWQPNTEQKMVQRWNKLTGKK